MERHPGQLARPMADGAYRFTALSEGVIRRLARARLFALGAGAFALTIGTSALLGWALGLWTMTSAVPGLASMKANSAVAIVLLGFALLVFARVRPQRWLVRAMASGAVLIGALSLAEYATGTSFGIDELISRDPKESPYPGRMAPATALMYCLVGSGAVAMTSARLARIGDIAHIAALGITAVVLVGYLYDLTELYAFGPFASVSLPAAVSGSLVALGFLVARPAGITHLAFEAGPGGALIRNLLPGAILIPVGLGFVVLTASRSGTFGPGLGLAAMVIGLIATLLFLMYRSAAALDRTEATRLRAEALARRASEREAVVTVTVADAIVTIDADSTIVFANPATDRIFGHPPGSLLGRPLTTLMPDRLQPLHRAGLARYVATGTRRVAWEGAELIGLRASGEEFPIDVSFAESDNGEGRTFTGIIRDISSRKRLEGQLFQAQRLETVGRLAGGIAHDFNNILTAMLGFNALALDGMADDDPRRADIEAVRDGGERAGRLVSQLLAFSRRQVLHPETISVAEVVRGIVPMLAQLIGSSVEVVLAELDPRAVILADRGQLEQVIVNLAVNARDAMPAGGRLTIGVGLVDSDANVRAIPSERLAGRHVELTVSDTGTGMDEQTKAHVFEPFFSTKGEGLGTGLGLATVYGIVQQSGGRIAMDSEPGRGSTFTILFPLAVSEPTPAEVPSSELARGAGRGRRILVVDDEAAIRRLVEKVLVREGYTVVVAEHVEAARARLSEGAFDLVLADVVMPGGSGLDFARELGERQPHLPVVVMSGFSAAALLDVEVGERRPELIEKPFTPGKLLDVVRRSIERGA